MGLLSFLKGQEPSGAERAGAAVVDPVQAARARARRRLVGAAVLLGVGVIGFPLLFETQPRPIAVDIPIDIPRKENAPSLPLPPPRVASAGAATPRVSSGVISERAPEPKRDAAPAAATKSVESPAPTPPSPGVAKAPPAPAADDGRRASALLEGRPVEPRSPATSVATARTGSGKSSEPVVSSGKAGAAASAAEDKADATAGRFVVQVAAYAEASAARDMRQRVEKLGLKSYTQVIEIDGAKRIRVRVGPFPARDEAEKAAATLKAAGLPAAVFTL